MAIVSIQQVSMSSSESYKPGAQVPGTSTRIDHMLVLGVLALGLLVVGHKNVIDGFVLTIT